MKPDEQELIVKHAFETPKTLQLSLMVGMSFLAIKNKLLLDDLGGSILAALGDAWLCTGDISDKSFTLTIRHRAWPDGLCVGLQDREEPTVHLFAAWRPNGNAR